MSRKEWRKALRFSALRSQANLPAENNSLAFSRSICSCFVHERRRGPQALNAISPIPPDGAAAARQARQLAMLQELAELGMALARAAAQLALAEISESHAAPHHDPGLTFARLSRAVRQTIALEARIAAGDLAPAPQDRPDPAPGDPRVPVVRTILHKAASAVTDRAARGELLRDIEDRLYELPDSDPDGDLCVDAIITAICNDLGLMPDLSRVSDGALALTRHGPPRPLAAPPDLTHPNGAPPRPNGPDPP